MDRDRNAAINILNRGIGTTGHIGTSILEIVNAYGDWISGLGAQTLLI